MKDRKVFQARFLVKVEGQKNRMAEGQTVRRSRAGKRSVINNRDAPQVDVFYDSVPLIDVKLFCTFFMYFLGSLKGHLH